MKPDIEYYNWVCLNLVFNMVWKDVFLLAFDVAQNNQLMFDFW